MISQQALGPGPWRSLLNLLNTKGAAARLVPRGIPAAILAAVLCGCAAERPSATSEYSEIYNKPLLSSGAMFSSLPPAVQNTVRAETGSSEIAEVEKGSNNDKIVYRISFENRDLFPPLYVASDGSLLDPDLRVVMMGPPQEHVNVLTAGPVTTVTLSDLPPAVVKSIQRLAPDAQVDSITKEVHKEVHGEQVTYLVSFKDRMHLPLTIASDGTVLAGEAK